MANTPSVSPSEVVKIIIYSENSDGTLSPSSAVSKSAISISPLPSPSEVKNVWLFSENADGTLSPVSGI